MKDVNISATTDEVLRPWTVNHKSDQVLHDAEIMLSRTIAQTSPQKRAGLRGSSSLEYLPEFEDFKNTFRETRGLGSSQKFGSPEKLTPISARSVVISRDNTPEVYSSPKDSQVAFISSRASPSSGSYGNSGERTYALPDPDDPIEKFRRRILAKEEAKQRKLENSPKKYPLSPVKFKSAKSPALFMSKSSMRDFQDMNSQFL
jgi:hypothetical protein